MAKTCGAGSNAMPSLIRDRARARGRRIAPVRYACAEGGWPMTASSSVVPFPAAKNRAEAHARFRDDWLSRLASDPDAFSWRFGHRPDAYAAHERKDPPGMAIP